MAEPTTPYSSLEINADQLKGPLTIDGGGLRYNKGKVRMDLIPPQWLQWLAEVARSGYLLVLM